MMANMGNDSLVFIFTGPTPSVQQSCHTQHSAALTLTRYVFLLAKHFLQKFLIKSLTSNSLCPAPAARTECEISVLSFSVGSLTLNKKVELICV